MPNQPNRIKLRQAGEAIVVHVERAQVSTTGKWPELELHGRDAKTHQPVIVSIPEKSAERQLTRLGLTANDLAGYTMGVSRKANPEDASKPYWNLDVVGEPSSSASEPYLPDQPVRGTAPVTPPEPPPLTDADAPPDALLSPAQHVAGPFNGDALYLGITEWVLMAVVPYYQRFEVGPTPEAVAAMVATLFIQHNRGR